MLAPEAGADNRSARICCRWVSSVAKGGMVVVSLYLNNGIGVASRANLDLLHQVAGIVNHCGRPWVIAADWQDPPEALAATGFLQLAAGRAVAPRSWTCNRRTIDYFVVSASLMPAMVAVLPVGDPPWDPAKSAQHCPVRLLLRAGPNLTYIRKIKAPKKVPAQLPC